MNKWSKKFWVICLLVSLSLDVFAKTAVRAESADDIGFRGWLSIKESLSPLSQEVSDSKILKEKLNRLLERAQKRFLTGSLNDARKEFLQITELALETDWQPAQRKALLLSFLRAAQLTESVIERKRTLEAAAAFAPDLKPDTKLFPPPLLAEFNQARKIAQSHAIAIPVRERFADFRNLIVDGRSFTVEETDEIRVLPGQHRITLHSDVYRPLSEVMSSAKFLIFNARRDSFASGTCERPEFRESNSAVIVYYSSECQYEFSNGRWARVSEGAEHDHQNWADLKLSQPDPDKTWNEIKAKPSIVKSKWFWIGIAAVASASILIIQRENSRRSNDGPPTHIESY